MVFDLPLARGARMEEGVGGCDDIGASAQRVVVIAAPDNHPMARSKTWNEDEAAQTMPLYSKVLDYVAPGRALPSPPHRVSLIQLFSFCIPSLFLLCHFLASCVYCVWAWVVFICSWYLM